LRTISSPVALHEGNELKILFLLSKYFSSTQNKSEQRAIELIFSKHILLFPIQQHLLKNYFDSYSI